MLRLRDASSGQWPVPGFLYVGVALSLGIAVNGKVGKG